MKGRHSRESIKRRKLLQRKKRMYMSLREELQLAGVLYVAPEGAIRDERVSPSTQSEPVSDLPGMVKQSLSEGWSTPDQGKRDVVAALLRPFYEDQTILSKDGGVLQLPTPPKLLNELAKTLILLDQKQYERNNPDAAGRAKGGAQSVLVALQMNVQAAAVIREMMESGLGSGETGLPSPFEPSTHDGGRFDGEVETGAVSTNEE